MLQKPKGELFLQSITNPGKERCFLSLCKMFLFFFMSRVVLISGLQAQEQFWEPRSLPRARWGRKLSSPAGFVPALRLSSVPLAPNPKKSRRKSRAWGLCHQHGRVPKISHLSSAASRSSGTAQGDTSPSPPRF